MLSCPSLNSALPIAEVSFTGGTSSNPVSSIMNLSCCCSSPANAEVGKSIVASTVIVTNANMTITNIITVTVLFIFIN
jgi:hypothetical protein